jgi:hypothetical protein
MKLPIDIYLQSLVVADVIKKYKRDGNIVSIIPYQSTTEPITFAINS